MLKKDGKHNFYKFKNPHDTKFYVHKGDSYFENTIVIIEKP